MTGDANSGWDASGVWKIPGPSLPSPSPVSVSPAQSSQRSLNLSLSVSDSSPTVAQDMGVVNILINQGLDGRTACYIAYSWQLNQFFLVNDQNTAVSAPISPGSGSRSNSQCTLFGSGSSAVASGTGGTLTVNNCEPAIRRRLQWGKNYLHCGKKFQRCSQFWVAAARHLVRRIDWRSVISRDGV